MRFGLFGYPNSGKKTLYELLTGEAPNEKLSGKQEGIPGAVPVRDHRLTKLAKLYNPQKVTPAVIDLCLAVDGIYSEAPGEEALEPVFRVLERSDVLGLMVRAFKNDAVFHVRGSVDPARDIREWLGELLLRDQLFVEKRLERLRKDVRVKRAPEKEKELRLFEKLLKHLEKEQPLRTAALTQEEAKVLRNYPLLTKKSLIIIVNVAEEDLGRPDILEPLQKEFSLWGAEMLPLSVKLELELAQLPVEEQGQFLQELGIEEPALEKLTRTVYRMLGRITYFTVGSDEVRAWSVPAGSTAQRAARAIHADLERGFIRAELIKYEDLIRLGSEQKVKDAGRLQLVGRDALVEDGDILSFRFNV